MIKKFKEFNESTGSPLSGIISKEEIEDQFLRIKEVMNHNVDIIMLLTPESNSTGNLCQITIFDSMEDISSFIVKEELKEELNTIKRRIQHQHPILNMIFIFNIVPDNLRHIWNNLLHIWIYPTDDKDCIERLYNLKKNKLYTVTDYLV